MSAVLQCNDGRAVPIFQPADLCLTMPIRSQHAVILVSTLPGVLVVHGAAAAPDDRASLTNLVRAIEHGCKQSPDTPWLHFLREFGVVPSDPSDPESGTGHAVQRPTAPLPSTESGALKLTFSNFKNYVEDDFAWAVADVDAEAIMPDDGRKIHGQGCETFLFRRERNHWKVVHTHGSPRPGGDD